MPRPAGSQLSFSKKRETGKLDLNFHFKRRKKNAGKNQKQARVAGECGRPGRPVLLLTLLGAVFRIIYSDTRTIG